MCLTYVIIQRCAGVCEQANHGGLGLGGDALLMVCAAVVLAGGIAAPAPGVAESGGPVGGAGSRNAVPCLLELDSPVTLWEACICASTLYRRLIGHRAHWPYIGRFRGSNHGQRDSLIGGTLPEWDGMTPSLCGSRHPDQ